MEPAAIRQWLWRSKSWGGLSLTELSRVTLPPLDSSRATSVPFEAPRKRWLISMAIGRRSRDVWSGMPSDQMKWVNRLTLLSTDIDTTSVRFLRYNSVGQTRTIPRLACTT